MPLSAPGVFRTLTLVLVSSGLFAACSKPAPVDEPVRAVKVMTVGVSPLESGLEFAGEVRPRIESRLGFRVGGKLTRRHVEVGQRVKAGQLLAQIDPQDYRLAADAAQAQLSAAITQRDLAAADFRRFKELREQNFISGAELERREATLKASEAQVEQLQAQLTLQRNQGGYANLVADVPGVVTSVEAEPGQVVSAGQPAVRIAQDGPRDVVFAVPEHKVAAFSLGVEMQARVWANGRVVNGRVREISASADPVTRTFQVKLALQGSNMPPLGATMTVMPASPVSARAEVIKLPTAALRQEGQATAVWLLDEKTMTVSSRVVQVATVDGNAAVIASGLTPGQQVVVAGVHVLSPGQKVTVYREKSPSNPASSGQNPSDAAANPSGPVAAPAVVPSVK